MRKHIIFGVLAAASTAAMSQTILPQTNKLSTGDAAHAWFPAGTGPTAGDANTRGLAYHAPSNRVLAADRDGSTGNLVQTIDAATFAYAGPVAGGSVAPATLLFQINKVRVATDGAIYHNGLGTTAGNIMTIFRHQDVLSTATVATTFSINARLGDDMQTTGGGNGIIGIIGGSGNTALWRLTSADGGITMAAQQLTVNGDTLAGFNYVSFDPDDSTTIWTRQGQASNTTSAPLKRFTLGVSTADFVSTTTPTTGGAGPHILARYNGVKYDIVPQTGAATAQAGESGKEVHLVNMNTNAIDYKGIGIERAGGLYSNTNGAGDVAWAPSINRIFVLQTSNAITAFSTAPAPAAVRDWNLY